LNGHSISAGNQYGGLSGDGENPFKVAAKANGNGGGDEKGLDEQWGSSVSNDSQGWGAECEDWLNEGNSAPKKKPSKNVAPKVALKQADDDWETALLNGELDVKDISKVTSRSKSASPRASKPPPKKKSEEEDWESWLNE